MKVDTVSQLTGLLAAHGVYALTILFLFYQQRSTYRDFTNATAQNRHFLQKVYRSSVVATYLLAALSTVAWGYTAFRRQPYVWIGGAIDSVRNAIAQPSSPAEPPSVVESIEAQGGSLQEFFHKLDRCEPKTSLCQLKWVLKTPSDIGSVVFKFRHTYYISKNRPSAADPSGSADGPIAENDTIDARFTIDAQTMEQFAGRELSLTYEPGPDAKQLGKLYLRSPDQHLVELPWEAFPRTQATVLPGPDPVGDDGPAWSRWWTVWASGAEQPKAAFGPRGEYEEEFGRSLRSWLGGVVDSQLMGVQTLVEAKSRAFRFIAESLDAGLAAGVNRSILISNLVRAAEEIEAGGVVLPNDLVLSLAVASAQQGNYVVSARLFDKVRGKAAGGPDWLFYRSLAYRETKRYPEAIADLERYTQDARTAYSRAVALTSMGISYRRSNNREKAVLSYRRAIEADPSYAGPYNALAYLQAVDPERRDFDEAQALVDKALKLRPQDPNYLDTKGWILFRMGRQDDAKRILEQAFAALPNNPEIRGHLDQVREARAQVSSPKQ